jgi:undecaprenyl-diphosphatase
MSGTTLRPSVTERVRLRLLPRRRETVDAHLFLAVNHLPHHRLTDRPVSLVSTLGKGAGWAVLGMWLALSDGERGRRAAVASVGAMLLTVGLVQGPVKALLPRRRPFHRRLAIVVGRRPVDSSFPSGHTAGSFAAATALGAFYPRQRPAALGLACGVGFSRLYLGHHFPSDVAVGGALGWLLGTVCSRLVANGCRGGGGAVVEATGAVPGYRRAALTGSASVNRLPRPSREATRMLPSWCRAISRAR